MSSSNDQRSELGFRGKVGVSAGVPLLRALALTWRIRFRNRAALDGLRRSRTPFIFSLWHGQLLPLLWVHRGEQIRILISEHRDGEIIAQIAHALGYGTVRGSSTKGGERALLELARVLSSGHEVAVTPDGPRGPAGQYQAGALVAAARAHAPILPIAASVDRAWRLSSWDRFIVPKPLARITVAYGDPVWIETATAREAAARATELERVMAETVRNANA